MTWVSVFNSNMEATLSEEWYFSLVSDTDLTGFSFAGSLLNKRGEILIPGINEAVVPLTDEELELYQKIDFDLKEYAKDVGATKLLHDTKVQCLFLSFFCPHVKFLFLLYKFKVF